MSLERRVQRGREAIIVIFSYIKNYLDPQCCGFGRRETDFALDLEIW
jgi:hypothetical protein